MGLVVFHNKKQVIPIKFILKDWLQVELLEGHSKGMRYPAARSEMAASPDQMKELTELLNGLQLKYEEEEKKRIKKEKQTRGVKNELKGEAAASTLEV